MVTAVDTSVVVAALLAWHESHDVALDSLVADVLDAFAAFEAVLGSHMISHEKKEGIIDRVFARRPDDDKGTRRERYDAGLRHQLHQICRDCGIYRVAAGRRHFGAGVRRDL